MPMKVESSPCIKVCEMDSTSKICVGCGRTAYEIKNWIDYSPNHQKFRKELAKERLKEHYETLFSE